VTLQDGQNRKGETLPFDIREVAFQGTQRQVMTSRNSGFPVIILHELFGISASLLAFAEMIEAAGFKTYLPVLFGSTEPAKTAMDKLKRGAEFTCVAHQFRIFSSEESGPWAEWLRHLVDWSCSDSGHGRAGAIGLCLTGNFVLSMAVNAKVAAPVMGEPSLPFLGGGLHATPAEVAQVRQRLDSGLEMRAYRFETDTKCKAGRFLEFEQKLGQGFKGTTLPATEKLHSVFTEDLRDAGGQLRHDKVDEVIDFLRTRLA